MPSPYSDLTELRYGRESEAEGAALRALCAFLSQADPNRQWGSLRRVPTTDGNLLWLCPEHRRLHQADPIAIPAELP